MFKHLLNSCSGLDTVTGTTHTHTHTYIYDDIVVVTGQSGDYGESPTLDSVLCLSKLSDI